MTGVRGVGGITPSKEPEKETKKALAESPKKAKPNALYEKITEILGEPLAKLFWTTFINTQIAMARKAAQRAVAAMKEGRGGS